MVFIILGLLLGCGGLFLWYLDNKQRQASSSDAAQSAATDSKALVVGGVEVHPVALESDESQVDAAVTAQPVGVALGEEEIESPADLTSEESLAAEKAATADFGEDPNPRTGEFPAIDEKTLAAHAAAEDSVASEAGAVLEGSMPEKSADGSDLEDSAPVDAELEENPAPVEAAALEEKAALQEEPAEKSVAKTTKKSGAAPSARSRFAGLRAGGFGIFHGPRRERKQWAQQHGFEYTKSDALLADEWTRNAAASGAAARDVISGLIHGYEVHFAELAGTEIMALRRAQASDVVVELQQRPTAEPAPQADALDQDLFAENSLVTVGTYGSFEMLSDEPAVASRLVDARFQEAVHQLTPAVARLWVETEWLLVEWDDNATLEDWEANLDVFAQLADVFRVLPPAATRQAPATLRKTQLDPSRNLPQYFLEPVAPKTESLDALPQVDRENAPVAMPTRGTALRKGEVELNALGNDEVDAIGQGNSGMDSHYGTRVLRSSASSSIFDDIVNEMGTDLFEEDFPSFEQLLDQKRANSADESDEDQQN